MGPGVGVGVGVRGFLAQWLWARRRRVVGCHTVLTNICHDHEDPISLMGWTGLHGNRNWASRLLNALQIYLARPA